MTWFREACHSPSIYFTRLNNHWILITYYCCLVTGTPNNSLKFNPQKTDSRLINANILIFDSTSQKNRFAANKCQHSQNFFQSTPYRGWAQFGLKPFKQNPKYWVSNFGKWILLTQSQDVLGIALGYINRSIDKPPKVLINIFLDHVLKFSQILSPDETYLTPTHRFIDSCCFQF